MSKKFNKLLTILVTFMLLSGCMVLKKYKNVDASDAATLQIKTFAKDRINMAVWHYQGEEYLDTKGEYIGRLYSTALGEEKTDNYVLKILPNQEFRFAISSALQEVQNYVTTLKTTMCKPHVGFFPKPGKSYVAEHRVSSEKCAIEIFEVSENIKTLEPTQLSYPSCLDPFNVAPGLFPEWQCKVGFKFR